MASHHEIVVKEWQSRSREMAEWAMERLTNRKDVWGQYASPTPGEQKKLGRTYKAMTLPVAAKRGPDMVTIDKLTRHFSSAHRQRPQIIGLHAKSKENTSRWLGIDIDMHDAGKADAEEHARRNLVGAINWWRQLQSMGYDPLLFDSNNNGGYHLWILFEKPASTDHVFAMAHSIVSTCDEDIRFSHLTDIVEIPSANVVSEELKLPQSELMKRSVATKELCGATMVRKLMMWKTNKEEESRDFPAYVLHLTDYSPNRKDPLKHDVRVSSSDQQIEENFAQWQKKYFVSGWETV